MKLMVLNGFLVVMKSHTNKTRFQEKMIKIWKRCKQMKTIIMRFFTTIMVQGRELTSTLH